MNSRQAWNDSMDRFHGWNRVLFLVLLPFTVALLYISIQLVRIAKRTVKWWYPEYRAWAILRGKPRRRLYKWCRRQAQAQALEDRQASKDQLDIAKSMYHKVDPWDYYVFKSAAIRLRHQAMTVNCKDKQKILWMMCGQPYFIAIQKELRGYHG